MPHCFACNKLLSDFEATRKIVSNGKITYPDLCNTCFYESDLPKMDGVSVIERQDLDSGTFIEDDAGEY